MGVSKLTSVLFFDVAKYKIIIQMICFNDDLRPHFQVWPNPPIIPLESSQGLGWVPPWLHP